MQFQCAEYKEINIFCAIINHLSLTTKSKKL